MPASTFIGLALLVMLALLLLRRFQLSRSLRHYDAGEVAEKLQSKAPVILLDVRTIAENRQDHITGSLNIPLHVLRQSLPELEPYRGREIVVYCASGNRSLGATYFLQKKGFNAVNLRGGISAWNALQRT